MREAVRVSLLGGFSVSVEGRRIREDGWRLKKGASLVKLLSLAPGHGMHRGRISDLLWPDLNSEAAANNFHYALHAARRALEPAATPSRYLRLAGEWLALCPDSDLWVDTKAFEEAASAARRSRDPAAYRAAVDLYAGDLLPEDRYESWAEARREELRTLRLALLVEMARLHENRGELEAAIETLGRVASLEPAHEEARAELMRLHAASGKSGEALRQYEKLREALNEQFDEEPSATSRRLYEQIEAGRAPERPEGTAPPEGQPDARHNLPARRTSFVGRERELIEVKRMLSMTRLLTLTGAGGAGKTRLALEAARDLAGLYPDGAWLVELAALPEGALVPQAFADALGVRERPGRPLAATLVSALKTEERLLVVDNCEHLVDAVAVLVDTLLDSCPRLRVLATSRETLRVAGEVNWPVPPLSVPGSGYPSNPEELSSSESARLFVERAIYRPRAFHLTQENAKAVAEICRKLDGVPLAIELAAAMVGALSVEQISEKLDDSLKLLSSGSRTAQPRQRTLRGALDWSYDLLGDSEKRLFERLSVFVGGWTLEAAEAVEAGGDIEEEEVLDLLGRLVDKSLVIVGSGRQGIFRYGLLEPVRQYGRERLEAGGEANRVRRGHAEYYLALAEEAEPELAGPRQVAWLERLGKEHNNLRAALSWALDETDEEQGERAGLGVRLAVALARFWLVFGLTEGRGWMERGLARSSMLPASVRAKALNEAGWIALFQGDGRAIAMLEESMALFEELGDKSGAATALANLGFALAHGGDRERVATLREEAEALRRERLDRRVLAHLLHFLTLAAIDAYDHEQAMALPAEALALYRELGDMQGVVISLTALGMTTLAVGDLGRAKAFFEENLKLLRTMGQKMGIAYCLLGLAGVAGEQARPHRAARLWGAAEALREDIGMHLSPFDHSHYRYENRLSATRSLLDDEEAWEAAWAEGRAMTPEAAIEYALSEEDLAPSARPIPKEPPARKPANKLSRREREVALLVARGLTNRRIAEELSISENTAANHVARIRKKLGLFSRSQIAVWVTEQRLRRTD